MADMIYASFVKERDTKNTVRYAEVPVDGEVKIGTLYIKKSALEAALIDADNIEIAIRQAN